MTAPAHSVFAFLCLAAGVLASCDGASAPDDDVPAAAGGKADGLEAAYGALCDEELAPCPEGLRCELDAEYGLVPVCKIPDGEACRFGDPCLRGSACAWDADLDPYGEDGGTCEPAASCTTACPAGFRCNQLANEAVWQTPEAICEQVPDADQGGACGGVAGARCIEGNQCIVDGNPPDGWPGLCRPAPSDCLDTGCPMDHVCSPCSRTVLVNWWDLDWSHLGGGLGGLWETHAYQGCVDLAVGYTGSFCEPPQE
ncbi:MAG: hypothetical protein AAGA54_16960 [Myxococcota bacterium]